MSVGASIVVAGVGVGGELRGSSDVSKWAKLDMFETHELYSKRGRHSTHCTLGCLFNGIYATCETRRLRTPESNRTGQGLIAQNPPQDGIQTRETSGLGFAKQATAADVAGGCRRWQQAGSGSKQAGLASRTVLRAVNISHPIMAGSRARGRRSVTVWLTSSAVSICIATDRLRSSPLVQSLPMSRTLLAFLKSQNKFGRCWQRQGHLVERTNVKYD